MGELDPRNRLALPRPAADVGPLLVFAAAIFLGAFLIFQVQPIISKHILPWFGGAPTVWTTCVLVFQCLLFAGYAYAHLGTRWLGPRVFSLVHLALLAGAAWMSVLPSESCQRQPYSFVKFQVLIAQINRTRSPPGDASGAQRRVQDQSP